MDYKRTKIAAVTMPIVVFLAMLSLQAASGNAAGALFDDLRNSNKEVEAVSILKVFALHNGAVSR